MAQTATPYGLRPVQLLGGVPFAGAIRTFPLLANSAKAFFFGDPVGLVAGQLTAIVASPTTTVTANNPIGVFMGAEWQDPIRGFVNSQYCPANLITGGATQVKFKILDHPKAVFKIQANGSVPIGSIGLKAQLLAASIGTGSTATGDSTIAADPAVAVTATFALTIVGFPNAPGSAPGDPFTDLLVIWNSGVHRWEAALGL
jgi:hypothetical protein